MEYGFMVLETSAAMQTTKSLQMQVGLSSTQCNYKVSLLLSGFLSYLGKTKDD
jgi:hypothetical protein